MISNMIAPRSEANIYAPMHRQLNALDGISDPRLREILRETLEAINATVMANFLLLVVQRLEPLTQKTASEPLHLSKNFGTHSIFSSGMILNDVLEIARSPEKSNHMRNQTLVGLCCALENGIKQIADHLNISIPTKSKDIESYPVRIWAGIRDYYQELGGGEDSRGFEDNCLRRLQTIFWVRNSIVHKDAEWPSILDGYHKFWKKTDYIQTEYETIDAIIQWIDNELLHSWSDLDTILKR